MAPKPAIKLNKIMVEIPTIIPLQLIGVHPAVKNSQVKNSRSPKSAGPVALRAAVEMWTLNYRPRCSPHPNSNAFRSPSKSAGAQTQCKSVHTVAARNMRQSKLQCVSHLSQIKRRTINWRSPRSQKVDPVSRSTLNQTKSWAVTGQYTRQDLKIWRQVQNGVCICADTDLFRPEDTRIMKCVKGAYELCACVLYLMKAFRHFITGTYF
jgi:hypothetical protein